MISEASWHGNGRHFLIIIMLIIVFNQKFSGQIILPRQMQATLLMSLYRIIDREERNSRSNMRKNNRQTIVSPIPLAEYRPLFLI